MINEILFAQGRLDNALKRIGVYKSNLFCIGEDPVSKSGVIISKGEIVSSKILDVTIKAGGKGDSVLSYNNSLLNTVSVKYVDAQTKSVETMEFLILSNEALKTVIGFILDKQQYEERLKNIEDFAEKTSKKLEKINDFLSKNKEQIESIEDLKNTVQSLSDKIDFIIKINQH